MSSNLAHPTNVSNITNSPNSSCSSPGFHVDWLVESDGVKAFKLTLQIIIGLFGVVGNVVICWVIFKSARMRSSTYYYITSLAIADLGVLLINFPLAVVKEHIPFGWPFGEVFCLYVYPLTDISFGASIWSIVVIAINRYRNIATRKTFRIGAPSKKSAVLAILTVWVLSFVVVNLPMYFVIKYSTQRQSCFPYWAPNSLGQSLKKVYTAFLAVFLYVLPLVIISFTYFSISRRLQQSNTFLKSLRNEFGKDDQKSEFLKKEEKKMLKKNKKAKKILTPLVVLFATSMLPLNAFRLVMAFYPMFVIWRYYWVCFSAVIIFTIINSSSNPIVYAIASREFRVGIKNLFQSCPSVNNCLSKTVDSKRARRAADEKEEDKTCMVTVL